MTPQPIRVVTPQPASTPPPIPPRFSHFPLPSQPIRVSTLQTALSGFRVPLVPLSYTPSHSFLYEPTYPCLDSAASIEKPRVPGRLPAGARAARKPVACPAVRPRACARAPRTRVPVHVRTFRIGLFVCVRAIFMFHADSHI